MSPEAIAEELAARWDPHADDGQWEAPSWYCDECDAWVPTPLPHVDTDQQAGRIADAQLVTAWLTEQGHHPALIAADIDTWTDFDWQDIANQTGIPCPPSVRQIVAHNLRADQ